MELSACIVVYNGCDEALKAAQTVLQYTRRHPLTLYLVDNASPDGSGARLEAAVKGGALSTQPGSYSWLVVDQAMVDASSVIQGYIKKGYTVTGATYEELGKAMGVDAAAFAETMEKWNGYVEAKNDPDFGRTSFANPLNTAPYYAVKVTAGVHHTMGGLKINANTEVLNEKGEVIPGLFAAGEVTGGVHGANRLGGNAVADFTVFGRIAGAAASDYAA